jgi:hypothetical protein
MSEHDDQLNGHPVHQMVRDLAARIRDLDVPDTYAVRRTRAVDVLGYAERVLAATDRALVSVAMFDQMQQVLSGMADSLAQFESTHDVAYLDEVTGPHSDSVVVRAGRLPALSPDELAAAASEQVKVLSDLVQAVSDRWTLKEQELTGQVDALNAELAASKTAVAEQAASFEATVATLTATATEQQAAHAATLTEQQAAHDATVTALEAQLTTAISDFETRTATDRTDFETKAAAILADTDAKTTASITAFETQSTTALADLDAEFKAAEAARVAASDAERKQATEVAGALLAELTELRDDAAELVGTVASTGTAGHFKQVAEAEKKSADLWRWISLGFAVVAVGVAMWAAIHTATSTSVAWQAILAKVLLTVTLGGIAAYAGQQSSGHREQERSARHTQLQLSSVDAFLHSVDDEQKAEIRKELANHVFGARQAPAAGDAPLVAESPGTAQLIAVIAEAVAKGAK